MSREIQIIDMLNDEDKKYNNASEVYDLLAELQELLHKEKTCFFCKHNVERSDGNVCKLGIIQSLEDSNDDYSGCNLWLER